MALSETFLRGNERLNIDGYVFYGHNRENLHRNATRGSAGIGILVKRDILESFTIQILDIEFEGIMWIKFQSKFSDLIFMLAVCYLPPNESSRALDSDLYFQNLLKQLSSRLSKFGKNYNVWRSKCTSWSEY